jgi:enoyl-CoA hydratase/carnithine racemase
LQDVLFDIAGSGVATVTLNRPERKNALSIAAAEALHRIWQEVDDNPSIRVLVITSHDCGVFCAGMDLTEASQVRKAQGRDILQALSDPFYERLRAVRKPVIAALNGHFTAAGMVLAVNSDLRIGMAGTRAGITEVRVGRGTPWAAPMLTMLPQAILNEMLMTGEMLAVERLHAVGFLNYLEPDAQAVRTRAVKLAEQICGNAPLSVLAAKHCVKVAAAFGADEGFRQSKEFHRTVYESEDAQEGPRAYAEKRAPVWKGR